MDILAVLRVFDSKERKERRYLKKDYSILSKIGSKKKEQIRRRILERSEVA